VEMRRVLMVILLGIALSACAPRFEGALEPPIIRQVKPGLETRTGAAVSVARFGDATEGKPIVKYRDKEVMPAAPLIPVVEGAVADAFKAMGFAPDETAPLLVTGEIRTWKSKVSGSMPAKAESEASVYIEVLDPANKRIYSGVYTGTASYSHPSLGTDDVRESLSTAMVAAIEQITADKQRLDLLSSF